MNWQSIGRFIGGSDKVDLQRPKVTIIPLSWFFGVLAGIFFLCGMKWDNIVFAWLAALSFIGFALFYVLDKRC
jgi:hypothetical protein